MCEWPCRKTSRIHVLGSCLRQRNSTCVNSDILAHLLPASDSCDLCEGTKDAGGTNLSSPICVGVPECEGRLDRQACARERVCAYSAAAAREIRTPSPCTLHI